MNEYYRWTTQGEADLILGKMIPAVCTDKLREHCVKGGKGCTSILKSGTRHCEGNTDAERISNKERTAKEAFDKCRLIKVVIKDIR